MPLQEIYYIAEIVVGIAVITSIVFVAIELRQNTYMLRQSIAEQRESHINWLHESIVMDTDFREFHARLPDWEAFNDDDRRRAVALGVRNLRSILNEVASYFDGKITSDEFKSLKWNAELAATRPHVQAAYGLIKPSYSIKVQKFWEELHPDLNYLTEDEGALASLKNDHLVAR